MCFYYITICVMPAGNSLSFGTKIVLHVKFEFSEMKYFLPFHVFNFTSFLQYKLVCELQVKWSLLHLKGWKHSHFRNASSPFVICNGYTIKSAFHRLHVLLIDC